MPDLFRTVTRGVALLGTIVMAWVLFRHFEIKLTGQPSWSELVSLIEAAAAIILALLFGFGLLKILEPSAGMGSGSAAATGTGDPQQPMRDRLARNVVAIGSSVIALLSALLISAIALTSSNEQEVVRSGMSVFSSVVPVFATWVGTVLAFYFTNESFRQAAQSTKEMMAGADGAREPLTRAGTMIPYDRVTKYEIPPADMQSGITAEQAAEKILYSKIESLFSQTATRVMIFDPNRHAVFVIRKKRAPPSLAPTATLADYLNVGENRTDAKTFRVASAQATMEDGKRIVQLYKVSDLFITERGTATEPVLGWVPDDNLR